MTVLSFQHRVSGHANAIRSKEVRKRVKHVLLLLGETDGPNPDARYTLIRAAIKYGTEKGIRLWSANTFPTSTGAMSSLRTLLEEKETVTDGVSRTGVNQNWVLNLWEGACDAIESRSITEMEAEATSTTGMAGKRSTVATCGNPPKRPLSVRLIEAFMSMDQDQFMTLLTEVIELEAS